MRYLWIARLDKRFDRNVVRTTREDETSAIGVHSFLAKPLRFDRSLIIFFEFQYFFDISCQ